MKVCRGTTRLVILVKSIAIKVPDFTRIFQRKGWFFFLKGILQNEEERKIWSIAKSTEIYDDKLLCPIIWTSWGSWIAVMKRCQPVDEKMWKWINETFDDSPYQPWIDNGLHQDNKKSNFGMLDNQIVKLDYGV